MLKKKKEIMLRSREKTTTLKNPTRRTKGSSLLLIPAVLGKKCLLTSNGGVRQPWDHACT